MGEVFAGRYELLDLIGHGGMGSVWRVHDRRTDQVVAAKVLRQSDAASLLRFVRESAFRVQHPHVITPLGWAGEDDRVLFTMPVVDGGSVAILVGDHGALPAPFVAEVLRQLLDGLSAVHASRIVHRDVKPANILLGATGAERPHAYLTDFGIAIELDGPRLTETDVAIGTRGYMAPEQRRGEVTTASDLYAVGAVARHMLTASPSDVDPLTLDPPDGVPDSLWALTSDLLQQDPDQRPDAAAATARLQAPELAWTSAAAGDVEVLQQVFDTEGGDTGLLEPTTQVMGRRGEDEGDEPPAPRQQSQPQAQPPRSWIAVLVAAVAAVIITGVLIVWSPWSGESPSGEGVGPSTRSSSASTPISPDATETSSSPSNASSEATRTTGSVEVGVVVTNVGQQCVFSDVGMRETTSGGVDVQCRRGDDGAYAWERVEP